MFNGEKYITKGVSNIIPEFLQNILWHIIDIIEIDNIDYLQVFELSEIIKDEKRKQKIVHFQEQPEFKEEFIITTKKTICEKIYIIDNGIYSTMLLASEY